jgi:hypothetical protein
MWDGHAVFAEDYGAGSRKLPEIARGQHRRDFIKSTQPQVMVCFPKVLVPIDSKTEKNPLMMKDIDLYPTDSVS